MVEGDHQFSISLTVDKKAKTLLIAGNGIGMNHADLLETLGTIAKSGTGSFLESLKDAEKGDLGLIGQFGVGFYSPFMVAYSVDVISRKAGETETGYGLLMAKANLQLKLQNAM